MLLPYRQFPHAADRSQYRSKMCFGPPKTAQRGKISSEKPTSGTHIRNTDTLLVWSSTFLTAGAWMFLLNSSGDDQVRLGTVSLLEMEVGRFVAQFNIVDRGHSGKSS